MYEAIFTIDKENRTLVAERQFKAPLSKVWEAHTKSELLEQWWAPKPWKAVTKTFDFREGGHWHYYMLGPEGEKNWCWMTYESIENEKSFSADDYFCDENGKKDNSLPGMHWKTEFFDVDGETKIRSTTVFATIEDLEKIVAMGVQEGYTLGLNQLEELLTK